MKLGLLLNVVDPLIGGVLIMGHRGTGKSTAVRALADLLPQIDVVAGCPYNCDPKGELCDQCRGSEITSKKMPVPVVELPLGAPALVELHQLVDVLACGQAAVGAPRRRRENRAGTGRFLRGVRRRAGEQPPPAGHARGVGGKACRPRPGQPWRERHRQGSKPAYPRKSL